MCHVPSPGKPVPIRLDKQILIFDGIPVGVPRLAGFAQAAPALPGLYTKNVPPSKDRFLRAYPQIGLLHPCAHLGSTVHRGRSGP